MTDDDLICDLCLCPCDELMQRADWPGVVDKKTGNYRCAMICTDCRPFPPDDEEQTK